jgi:hypothetical protein
LEYLFPDEPLASRLSPCFLLAVPLPVLRFHRQVNAMPAHNKIVPQGKRACPEMPVALQKNLPGM